MKKQVITGLILLIFMVLNFQTSAIEHEFGGYWRVRMFTNQNFSGSDSSTYDGVDDLTKTDTRARIYYTAVLNENLKIVNKFEMDAVFGDGTDGQYGDIGADGVAVEVKNSYADFTIDPVNVKLGVHGATIARGFIFDDDFAGFTITYKRNDISFPFYWMKVMEGGKGKDKNDGDLDYYAFSPVFKKDAITINPYLFIGSTQDMSAFFTSGTFSAYDKALIYYLGGDVSGAIGPLSLWATGIFENGTLDSNTPGGDDLDVTAFLFGVGGSADIDGIDVHGELFYASGDDDSNDDEYTKFFVPKGQSYYWGEIMGYGLFDDIFSNASPGDQIGDVMAFNVGASFKPMPKLTLGADLWYASLAEEDSGGDEYLGTEIDLSLTYEIMEGMNLDAAAAMLFAGDSTNPDSGDNNGVNPYEVGVQLSVKF